MKFNQFNFHLLVAATVVGLLAFEYFGLAKFFDQGLAAVFRPAQAGIRQLVVGIEWPAVMAQKSINSARKVQMLEERYSEALAQLTDLKQLERENNQLKALLENSDREDRVVIISAPIVSQVGPTVGAGARDGVVVGDLVFVSRTLIGRVREVFPDYSEVDLIYQTDFQPLVAQTSDGYRGLVRGDGRRAIFTEVSPEETPLPESRLETVGQVGVDKGLFIGQVGRLLSSSADTVKTYQVIQHIDFYEANLVEIYK